MQSESKYNLPKLTGINYHTWKQRIELLLTKEELWDVIADPIPNPITTEWTRKDRQARASIGLAVEDKLLIDIKHQKTAKEVWDKLSEVHQHDSLGSRLALYRKIFSVRFQYGSNLADHISEILDAASKLEDRGHPLEEELICAALLGSLPREFNALITAIEGRNTKEITVSYIREKIQEEYTKTNGEKSERSFESKALYNRHQKKTSTPRNNLSCFYCHKVGHVRKDCRLLKQHGQHREFIPGNKTNNRNGVTPHSKFTTVTPWDIVTGEPDPAANITEEIPTLAKALITTTTSHDKDGRLWVIDSGASQHMCNTLVNLQEKTNLAEPTTITTASGEEHQITYQGDYTLKLITTSGKTMDIHLKNVVCVPALTDNLISMSQLDKLGYTVEFGQQKCMISRDEDKALLATLGQQLYTYRESPIQQQVQKTPKHQLCKHIVHQRLGHKNQHDTDYTAQILTREGIILNDCNNQGLCSACTLTKMSNIPFKTSTRIKAQRLFEVLHTDLCGPITPTSIGNNNYALCIIDEYSKYASVYAIKHKHEVFYKIREYIEKGINMFGRRPTTLRSDGGGEFDNNKLNHYLEKRGISHKITLPYTPQNNGTVERFNRTVMETTRALLQQTQFPKNLWGELLATACYLTNRVLHKEINKTPYELWFDSPLEVSNLITIGTGCYFLNPTPHKKKLDNRSISGFVTGYGESNKIYRIWEPTSNKIYMSRCVKFEQEKCPLDIHGNSESMIYFNQPVMKDPNTSEHLEIRDGEQAIRKSNRPNLGKPPLKLTYRQGGQPSHSEADWYAEHATNSELSERETEEGKLTSQE